MGPSAGTVLFVVLALAPAAAYYIPGAYPREFKRGEALEVNVNSLISFHSELPYDFYSLPVCKPREGVKRVRSTINPGTILVGSRIFNSVYNFTMMEQSLGNIACMAGSHLPLTGTEVKVLKHRIDREYRMRFILDNLPATTYDLNERQLIRPGVEIGYRIGKEYHLFNHLVFNVLYHRTHGEYSSGARLQPYSTVAFEDGRKLLAEGKEEPQAGAGSGDERFMVVGFEVMPCSVRRTPGKPVEKVTCGLPGEPHNPEPLPIEEGMKIVYTYDVYFQESSVDWANRWDAYLTMPGGHVHWFSLFNSALVLLVMAAIAAMVLMRTVRRDLQKYEELLIEAQSKTEFQDESGWKLVSGDVLRQPPRMESLVVQAGSGVQILGTCMVTVFFGVLGFLSPASRGSLLTALIVLYLLLAFTAGFSATWLYGYITQGFDRWPLLCLKVSCYYPGIVGLVVTVLDLVLAGSGTTGAVPFSTFFSLLALWFIVSIPLSYMGGFIASRMPLVKHPTATNQIPRHIPPPPVSAKPWLLFFAAGLLPGTIFVELSFAMASMWQGYYYYLFGFMFLVGLLVVIVTAEVAILTTYVQLCAEDYRWWWMSFRRGGSIALYVMLYALGYLLTVLRDFGSLSVMMYLCYMGVMCLGLYLCMGAVGFFTSLWFTHAIFASVKAD